MKINWYCPPTVNKDFKDPIDNPSFRLRCWYTHLNLIKDGHSSFIVDNIEKINNPDIVILMSFGEEEYNFTKWMKNQNKTVIHDYSENIRGIPILEQTKELCKYIVCCSTELGKKESEVYKNKVIVIKDPSEEFPIKHNSNYDPEKLKIVWSGMGGNAEWVTQMLKPLIENLGMSYVEISNRKEADITWDRKTWYFHIAECDICICPQIHWMFPMKSNVKVTTAMSLGLPVIASPITSYSELIKNGENGYIANTFEDWETYLNHLRSKQIRQTIVKNAEKKLLPYRISNIYKQWVTLFKKSL